MQFIPWFVVLGIYVGLIAGLGGFTVLTIFKERITRRIGAVYWLLLELYLFLSIISLLSLLCFSSWLKGVSEEYLASAYGFLSWTMFFVIAVSAVYVLFKQAIVKSSRA